MPRVCVLFATLFVLSALTACGQGQNVAATTEGAVTPVFAFSEAVVGPNRMPIGIIRDGSPLNDPKAKVHLRFFRAGADDTQPRAEADATYYGQGLPAAVYVAYATFDQAGAWNIEVSAQASDMQKPIISRLRLEVLPQSEAPRVGDQAKPIKTLTIHDVSDPAQLSSGTNPDLSLYQISLDDALKSGKPTTILFATPAYCRTAVCSPSATVISNLQKKYGDRINFIHAEVYKYPFDQAIQKLSEASRLAEQENRPLTATERAASFSDPMVQWNLPTEPWLYLIDANGVIAARYEGGITSEELDPMMQALIRGETIMPVAGK